MTYTKQTWANGVAGGTPISAARLNYIEDGIEAAATGTPDLTSIFKPSAVRVVSVASINLSAPGATIDGVTMAAGDRVLAAGNGTQAGLYVWNGSASSMTRTTDADTSAKVTTGMTVYVAAGTANAATVWRLTTQAPIVLNTTSLTFTNLMSSPHTGANSERFGAASAAAGASSAAFGFASSASGANAAVFGYDAVAAGAQGTSIGRSSRASGSGGPTACGYAATASGSASTAVGSSAVAAGASSLSVGASSSVASGLTGSIAIGNSASIVNNTFVSPSLAVGYQARVLEGRGTALGPLARGDGISSTAVGRGAIALTSHGIAVGRGSFTPATGTGTQLGLGWSGGDEQTDIWFECGHTHKYDDPIDSVTITRTPSLIPIAIHGFDAFDATGSPTNNITGGPLLLCAGRGTGTAAGGAIKLQVAPAGGASNNTKNALVNVVEVGVSGTASTLGVFATSPIVKQTVTGSKATGAAWASLLTAMAAYGFVTDSSSA